MLQQQDEKLEILFEVLPEVERFTQKATAFRAAIAGEEIPNFEKTKLACIATSKY